MQDEEGRGARAPLWLVDTVSAAVTVVLGGLSVAHQIGSGTGRKEGDCGGRNAKLHSAREGGGLIFMFALLGVWIERMRAHALF